MFRHYETVEFLSSLYRNLITAKPVIMQGPGSKTVTIGETVILRCDVAGNPKASITWNFPKVDVYFPGADPDNHSMGGDYIQYCTCILRYKLFIYGDGTLVPLNLS